MANSVILVTWINKEYPTGINRQLFIPPDVDPRSLSDADIWDRCFNAGFNIHGSMSWEILVNNSHTCYQTEAQLNMGILYKQLLYIVQEDPEALELLRELYEIAHDSADRE